MKVAVMTAAMVCVAASGVILPAAGASAPIDARSPVYWTPPEGTGPAPDVWVCYLPTTVYWGASGDTLAFSVATTSANAGNVDLNWVHHNTQHPVIAQNMYRIKDGVIDQVGLSWVKHGLCALQQAIGCGNCTVSPGCLAFLKPGCADPYDAGLNAQADGMGPRSEVNPVTGAFVWPNSSPTEGDSMIRARLQVNEADALPALNPGAVYVVEGHYIHPQDAQAGMGDNNATWRRIDLSNLDPASTGIIPSVGPPMGMTPAIMAWPEFVEGVQLSEVNQGDGADGRFIVGSHAQDLGDGAWRYHYAAYNMNSDRAAGSLSVPLSSGVSPSELRFHAPRYHSGEPYSDTPWAAAEGAGALTWTTEAFSQNENANALRWGTLYTFGFVANASPQEGSVSLGMFKPGGTGAPDAFQFAAIVPGEAACIGDLNGDGEIDGADLAVLLSQWGMSGSADLNGSGEVDGADLAILLANWGNCQS